MNVLKLNTLWWNVHQIYIRKKIELTKKSKMRREKLRAAFRGGVPDVWQFFIKQRVGLAVIQAYGGKTDNNLHKYIQVVVRDEVICFEESFHFKGGTEVSWEVKRTKEKGALLESREEKKKERISDDWKFNFILLSSVSLVFNCGYLPAA